MTQKTDPFVHLHVHTDASLLDGYGTAKETVNVVAELGQPAVAFTDHGKLTNLYSGYEAAKQAGLNFIAGIEAYFTPSTTRHDAKESVFFGDGGRDDIAGSGAYTHLTILAENNKGLANLFKLNLRASTEGYHRKPRMSLEMLADHSEGLIVTTGCPSGEIQTRLRLGQYDQALGFASQLVDIVGHENVFVELMDHDMKQDLERKVRKDLLRIAATLNLPLVATNDVHYSRKEDCHAHEEMLAIQTNSTMSELPDHAGGKRFAFEGDAYYVKSAAEMYRLFPEEDFPGACSNTLVIAERANIEISYRDDLRPRFEIPEGFGSEEEYLRHLAYKGFQERLPEFFNNREYNDRLEKELSVIIPKNYANYFLVTSDLMRWARSNGIAVGSARGSAGGSLLAFVMYITDVDPIKHDLLFERFLNPERDSPPDVDLDFDDRYRDRVYEYVVNKYGYEHVSQVVTFGRIKGKNSLKDEARIYEYPYSLSNELTKAYPPDIFGKSMPLNDIYNPESKRYEEAEGFRQKVKELNAEKIVESALKLEGRTRSTGVHACAVIISGKPLTETVPLEMRQSDKTLIAQWEYPSCESIGLLKMDFLGLRNLGIVQDALGLIKKRRGIDVDLDAIKKGQMDDPATFRLLAQGNTLGVFQLDGGPMRDLLKMMKPTTFDDISAVLALYRPGPMGVNAHTDYALRKNGLQEISYIHPDLEEALKPILEETYGLCVAGDTLVWDATSGKLVRIDSIEEEVKKGEFYTFSVNDAGRVERKRVTHWFNTGVKPIYEITSSDGRMVRVSGDHPVLTLEGYKKASELSEEDFVASAGEMFSSEKVNDLSVEEARLLGYLLGDGYVNFYQNTFINSDEKLLDHVAGLAKSLFSDVHPYLVDRFKDGVFSTSHLYFAANPQGVGRGCGVKNVYRTGFQMNQWLKRLFDVNGTVELDARSKFVPEAVFGADLDVVRHFLASLWDTDGHVGRKATFLKTVSKQLALDVQLLLDRAGYHGYVYETGSYVSAKHGETVSYGVYVYDAEFYSEVVPLMKSDKKNVVFEGGQGVQSRSDRRVNLRELCKDVYPLVVKDRLLPSHVRSRLVSAGAVGVKSASSYLSRNSKGMVSGRIQVVKGSHSVTQNGLVQEYLGKYASQKNLMNSNLRWSRVKSIVVSAPERVYDITVEGNHNFFANGVVVHNCIYQEQIMKIAQVVAGYSLGEADLLRRAMGKKKKEEMDKQWVRFSSGAAERGFSKEAVQALWDTILPFADYAFNKSHSVGYGYMSYITAYLKANFPAEFMSALLTSTADDSKKTALYLEDAKQNKLKVLPPDIQNSERDYAPLNDNTILFGLKAIKGVSDAVSDMIVAERTQNGKFADFSDVMNRLPRTIVNKRVFEALAYGGAFDSMGYSRKAVVDSLEFVLKDYQKTNRAKAKQETMGASLFDGLDFAEELKPRYEIAPAEEYPNLQKLQLERDYLGLYVSGHPLDGLNFDGVAATRIGEILSGNVPSVEGFAPRGKEPVITIAGIAPSYAARPTKKGTLFGAGVLEDRTGTIEFVMFSKTFEQYNSFMRVDGLYALTGYPQKRGEGFSFIVNSVRPLEFSASGNMPVRVKVTKDQWDKGEYELLLRLQSHEAVGDSRGTEVVVSIRDFDGSVSEETLPIKVIPSTLLTSEIRELFGLGCIGRWRARVTSPQPEVPE